MTDRAIEAAAIALSPHLRYYGGINPDNDDVAESRSHAHNIARKTISAYLSALVEDEEVVDACAGSGLARDLMMWLDLCAGRPTGRELYRHLSAVGTIAPDWLRQMIPDDDTVPPKGVRSSAIFRAALKDNSHD